ncbi:MAG: hypothetical protein WAV05_02870 [Anaerolineales bacterium]
MADTVAGADRWGWEHAVFAHDLTNKLPWVMVFLETYCDLPSGLSRPSPKRWRTSVVCG